jgi:glycolate oxidase FAD binding subunit
MSDVLQRPPREPFVPPGGHELLARDMTATFSADCTLRLVQEKLGEIGQWLPVDGDPDATLGSLIERNSSGPLRLGYGAWRDLLLGVQFTNGRGELISPGGMTVKNVAGYDLTKFIVGSFGVFGRLITFTARTYRKPDGARLARFVANPATLHKLLATPLRPQWSLLTREELLCGYLGDSTTLEWYQSNLGSLEPMEINGRSLDEDIAHRGKLWQTAAADGSLAFRAAVPPASVKAFTDALSSVNWVADPAFGIVTGSTDESGKQRLRDAAKSVGGQVRFGSSSDDLDVSTNPAERQIIERLKTAFDPDNRLQPLPWQRR